jgi:hypothetical protein
MAAKTGDLFEHGPSGAVFTAVQEIETDSCEGCAGDVSQQVCNVMPRGCSATRIIWKPFNTKAEVLAVTLRLEA